jgi:hypothetical protein
MKKLMVFCFVALALSASVAYSSDIVGDTNGDGVMSGSEQYLLENPDTTGSNVSREEIQHGVKLAKIQQQIAAQEALAQQRADAPSYRDQLLAQSQQRGNLGDRAVRESANRELDRMAGISTAPRESRPTTMTCRPEGAGVYATTVCTGN